MARKFTKYPSTSINASTSDVSYQVAEEVKHALFDINNLPQSADDSTEHFLEFVTWAGDGHSFIVNYNGEDYRVMISKEI